MNKLDKLEGIVRNLAPLCGSHTLGFTLSGFREWDETLTVTNEHGEILAVRRLVREGREYLIIDPEHPDVHARQAFLDVREAAAATLARINAAQVKLLLDAYPV
jgi:hypothetical protein